LRETVTFLFVILLLHFVPGHHHLQDGVKKCAGLGQDGVDVPLPLNGFKDKENFGSLVEQFGGDGPQAKVGVGEVTGFIFGGAVKRFEPLDDF
jgi:hypothetical protein